MVRCHLLLLARQRLRGAAPVRLQGELHGRHPLGDRRRHRRRQHARLARSLRRPRGRRAPAAAARLVGTLLLRHRHAPAPRRPRLRALLDRYAGGRGEAVRRPCAVRPDVHVARRRRATREARCRSSRDKHCRAVARTATRESLLRRSELDGGDVSRWFACGVGLWWGRYPRCPRRHLTSVFVACCGWPLALPEGGPAEKIAQRTLWSCPLPLSRHAPLQVSIFRLQRETEHTAGSSFSAPHGQCAQRARVFHNTSEGVYTRSLGLARCGRRSRAGAASRASPQRLLPYSRGDIPVLVIGGHINFAPSNLVERHMHRRPFYLL